MNIDELVGSMLKVKSMPALLHNKKYYSYSWLIDEARTQKQYLFANGISKGDVIFLQADYSPISMAMFLALLTIDVIIVPLTNIQISKYNEYKNDLQPDYEIKIDENDVPNIIKTNLRSTNPLINTIRQRNNPGLIIMSSGTTGKSKAIVHDFIPLLENIKPALKPVRVISFLLFDHIGGINTILNAFASGNCLIIPKERTPVCIAELIEGFDVNVLITSPSFLTLMHLNRVFDKYNLNNLSQINYGSEVMAESLLKKLITKLPNTKLNQAYGLSELGVIKTQSINNSSTLIKIIDSSVEYRVRDSKLEIKSKSSMLGYLNQPSPFTSDGWFMTEDIVTIDDDGIRILGRESDIINVGGEKVYPSEVEDVLLELSEVEDVFVIAEQNSILGNIVVANIKLKENVDEVMFKKTAKELCLKKLARYQLPHKYRFVTSIEYGARYKKQRIAILKGEK